MKSLFLFCLMLSFAGPVPATERESWVRRHCPACSLDQFDNLKFSHEQIQARVLSVGRNRVELTFFRRPDSNGTFRVELNAGSIAGREELVAGICRQFGRDFKVNRVNYTQVYNTTIVGLAPSATYQTIGVLVCKRGVFAQAAPLRLSVPVEVRVDPININAGPRSSGKEVTTPPAALSNSASGR